MTRRSLARARRAGQTLTEWTLLTALFMIPISAYFFPKLLQGISRFFKFLAWDLTGPGI
jgi:hypothetical protein